MYPGNKVNEFSYNLTVEMNSIEIYLIASVDFCSFI